MSKNKKIVLVISDHAFIVERVFKPEWETRTLKDIDKDVPDLVVFTGGEDIDPALYNEEKLPGTRINPKRDELEKEVFEFYKDVPKVGICRGGQLLNVLSGGKMWQHVVNHLKTHEMTNLLVLENFKEGEKLKVSSTHHQMMKAGPDGIVIGIAREEGKGLSDKYVSSNDTKRELQYDTEVVWYPKTKSLCYQPHPEYLEESACSRYFFDLINHFFDN